MNNLSVAISICILVVGCILLLSNQSINERYSSTNTALQPKYCPTCNIFGRIPYGACDYWDYLGKRCPRINSTNISN